MTTPHTGFPVTLDGETFTEAEFTANGGTAYRTRLPQMMNAAAADLAAKVSAAQDAKTAAEAVLTDPGLVAVVDDLVGPDTIGTVAGIAAAVASAAENMAAIVDAPTQAAAAAASALTAINAPGTSATSATSLTIPTTFPASRSLTIQTGKNLVPGMAVQIAYTVAAKTYMHGIITAYDSATGALNVDVTMMQGVAGTYADWTISLSSPAIAGGSDAKSYFFGGM